MSLLEKQNIIKELLSCRPYNITIMKDEIEYATYHYRVKLAPTLIKAIVDLACEKADYLGRKSSVSTENQSIEVKQRNALRGIIGELSALCLVSDLTGLPIQDILSYDLERKTMEASSEQYDIKFKKSQREIEVRTTNVNNFKSYQDLFQRTWWPRYYTGTKEVDKVSDYFIQGFFISQDSNIKSETVDNFLKEYLSDRTYLVFSGGLTSSHHKYEDEKINNVINPHMKNRLTIAKLKQVIKKKEL